MKAFKYLSIVVLLVIALAIGGLIYLFSNLNQIIKETVETVGPQVTETSVLLDAVDVKPQKGRGELNDFIIANPSGFSRKNIFELDKLVLQFKPESVLDDVIVIDEITVKGLLVTAEQKGATTNIQELLKTLESHAGGEASSSESESSGESVKLIIKKFDFSDNALDFVTEKFGSFKLDLPSFQLNDIGQKENGLYPAELGPAIIKPLLKQAQNAIKDKYSEITKEKLKQEFNKQKEALKEKAKEKEAELKEDFETKKKEYKKELKEKENKAAKDVKDKISDSLGEEETKKLEDKVEGLKKLFN